MIHRRLAVTVLVTSLWIVACKKEPPPPPEPTGPTAEELAAQRRADSIAEAQRIADSVAQAEAAARAQAEQRMAEARATLEEMVFFDYDKSDIRSDAETVLRRKVEILRASPAVELLIAGHADERGSTEYNLALGQRRAESVRQFFADFGLDQNRFDITSFGEERPLVNEHNEAAWARNRRAEFEITAGADQINPVMNRPDR
ncbi:MAG TPA: OmpA family protein [Longimicrobiales bacterium]|nr:OmpA family protein [Longimicrobiales bacterium]